MPRREVLHGYVDENGVAYRVWPSGSHDRSKLCICRNCGIEFIAAHNGDGYGNYCTPRCTSMVEGRNTLPRNKPGAESTGWKGGRSKTPYLSYTKRYRAANREKSRAHDVVRYALKVGKIERMPCEVCASAESEAHHDDYAKQLDVRWFCRKHHIEYHRSLTGLYPHSTKTAPKKRIRKR